MGRAAARPFLLGLILYPNECFLRGLSRRAILTVLVMGFCFAFSFPAKAQNVIPNDNDVNGAKPMQIRNINRGDLRALLTGEHEHDGVVVNLAGGKMLQVAWPRLRDKRVRNPETGLMETVEAAGTFIRRRLLLRKTWDTPTPSGSYQPAGGIMFNVATQQQAADIRAVHNLFLFLSIEGLTHPHGEPDHAVNCPLDRVVEIRDTHDNILWRVMDDEEGDDEEGDDEEGN